MKNLLRQSSEPAGNREKIGKYRITKRHENDTESALSKPKKPNDQNEIGFYGVYVFGTRFLGFFWCAFSDVYVRREVYSVSVFRRVWLPGRCTGSRKVGFVS